MRFKWILRCVLRGLYFGCADWMVFFAFYLIFLSVYRPIDKLLAFLNYKSLTYLPSRSISFPLISTNLRSQHVNRVISRWIKSRFYGIRFVFLFCAYFLFLLFKQKVHQGNTYFVAGFVNVHPFRKLHVNEQLFTLVNYKYDKIMRKICLFPTDVNIDSLSVENFGQTNFLWKFRGFSLITFQTYGIWTQIMGISMIGVLYVTKTVWNWFNVTAI